MVVSAAVTHRIPAGWYRDLDDPTRRRWWNGVEWTEYYAPVTQPILTIAEPAEKRPTENQLAENQPAENQSPRRDASRRFTRIEARRVWLFVLLAALATANAVLLSILTGTA